jgi:hypothetical protein
MQIGSNPYLFETARRPGHNTWMALGIILGPVVCPSIVNIRLYVFRTSYRKLKQQAVARLFQFKARILCPCALKASTLLVMVGFIVIPKTTRAHGKKFRVIHLSIHFNEEIGPICI